MATQLIYTSTKRGLDFGRSGYCTVARSKGMRKNLISELESLSKYDFSKENKPIFSYRKLNIFGDLYYVCSRIASCGFDYTGRTNFIAHHVVFKSEELASIDNPANFLLNWDGWKSSWKGAPVELEENTSISINSQSSDFKTWSSFLDASNANFLTETLRCVFVNVDDNTFFKLLSESLSCCEKDRRWQYSFTSRVQNGESYTSYDILLTPAEIECRGYEKIDPHTFIASKISKVTKPQKTYSNTYSKAQINQVEDKSFVGKNTYNNSTTCQEVENKSNIKSYLLSAFVSCVIILLTLIFFWTDKETNDVNVAIATSPVVTKKYPLSNIPRKINNVGVAKIEPKEKTASEVNVASVKKIETNVVEVEKIAQKTITQNPPVKEIKNDDHAELFVKEILKSNANIFPRGNIDFTIVYYGKNNLPVWEKKHKFYNQIKNLSDWEVLNPQDGIAINPSNDKIQCTHNGNKIFMCDFNKNSTPTGFLNNVKETQIAFLENKNDKKCLAIFFIPKGKSFKVKASMDEFYNQDLEVNSRFKELVGFLEYRFSPKASFDFTRNLSLTKYLSGTDGSLTTIKCKHEELKKKCDSYLSNLKELVAIENEIKKFKDEKEKYIADFENWRIDDKRKKNDKISEIVKKIKENNFKDMEDLKTRAIKEQQNRIPSVVADIEKEIDEEAKEGTDQKKKNNKKIRDPYGIKTEISSIKKDDDKTKKTEEKIKKLKEKIKGEINNKIENAYNPFKEYFKLLENKKKKKEQNEIISDHLKKALDITDKNAPQKEDVEALKAKLCQPIRDVLKGECVIIKIKEQN